MTDRRQFLASLAALPLSAAGPGPATTQGLPVPCPEPIPGRVAIVAFFGTDSFSAQVTIKAGSSLFEPHDATHVGTPAKDVVLSWKNLLDASDQAGWSRRYGGIHFKSGDTDGRANGASIGWQTYQTAKTYFDGTAPPPAP